MSRRIAEDDMNFYPTPIEDIRAKEYPQLDGRF
jgi:hypothetical protein